jgi:Domain of unknown function (DUF4252)
MTSASSRSRSPRRPFGLPAWAALCAALCATLPGCGILGNLRGNPGYAAFGSPGPADTDRELALSLGPLPLTVARVVTKGDPELSPMLRNVKAVRVYTYKVNGDARRVRARMDRVRDRLLDDQWQQIVAVREDGELTSAFVKMEGHDRLRGLAVIVQDSDELVLVNVIGNLKPENFSAVMSALDIDVPGVTLTRPRQALAGATHERARD